LDTQAAHPATFLVFMSLPVIVQMEFGWARRSPTCGTPVVEKPATSAAAYAATATNRTRCAIRGAISMISWRARVSPAKIHWVTCPCDGCACASWPMEVMCVQCAICLLPVGATALSPQKRVEQEYSCARSPHPCGQPAVWCPPDPAMVARGKYR